jgi:hypothetical protein
VPYLRVPEALGSGANSLDAVVLTHAHLDHSALVPLLFKYGYDGPIYTTEPTRDLMGLLSLDYLDVAAKEGRAPPYESEMVRETIKHTITLEYGDVTGAATGNVLENVWHYRATGIENTKTLVIPDGLEHEVAQQGALSGTAATHQDDGAPAGQRERQPGQDGAFRCSVTVGFNDVVELKEGGLGHCRGGVLEECGGACTRPRREGSGQSPAAKESCALFYRRYTEQVPAGAT